MRIGTVIHTYPTGEKTKFKKRQMESLDVDFFGEENDKTTNLLPDGTVCHSARYGWCREQVWYCIGILAISPVLVVLMALGSKSARSVGVSLFWILVIGLAGWHAIRYRRYIQQIHAGCHMQGIFLFATTRDVVFRFQRAIGKDIEASISRDSLLGLELRRYCFQQCLVIESRGPAAPPKLIIPACWLIDSPQIVKQSLERHLDLGSGITTSVLSPYHSYLEGDSSILAQGGHHLHSASPSLFSDRYSSFESPHGLLGRR